MPKLSEIRAKKRAGTFRLDQTINLKELFGRDFKDQDRLKQAFGQVLIDHIVERTKDGKAVGGRKRLKAPYSKEYSESLEFKAAGKSRNKVNMTLSGDMLRSIDLLKVGANTITIGIDDSDELPKAFNHQTGDAPNMPKRPFFGLTNQELETIANKFRKEIRQTFGQRGTAREEAIEALAARVLAETADGED